MPKTVFLILAHEQPAFLGRLVHRLQHPDATVVVHVDRKAELSPFRAAVAGAAHLLDEADRIHAYWGAFSVIRATLNLLRAAVRLVPGAQRFHLLSGVDYPVMPVAAILRELVPDRELIQVDRALNPQPKDEFDRCAFRLFFGENRYLNPRTGPRWLKPFRAVIARVPRIPRYSDPVYYGPPHWALTRQAVDFILDIEQSQPDRINWFRYSLYPDEMVFHTLLKKSPRAGHIAMDGTIGSRDWHRRRAGPNYIDWENPNPGKPRVLELSDLPEIRASGAHFARKMHAIRSGPLLDALDSDR